MFSQTQTQSLQAPLDRNGVKKNPRGYDYIEGWKAISEANRIFGFDGWARETIEMRQLGEPELVTDKWRVAYHCRVRVTVTAGDRVIIRDGSGYGSGILKDVRDAHESAIKEAETDAMKRALMTFGNPFGLALYDKAQTQVVDGNNAKAATFVQEAKAKIIAFDSIVEMGAWWNSAEQKKARADAGITQTDMDDLKAEVAGRKSILEQGKQAA